MSTVRTRLIGWRQNAMVFVLTFPLLFWLGLYFASSVLSFAEEIHSGGLEREVLAMDNGIEAPWEKAEVEQLLDLFVQPDVYSVFSGQGPAAGCYVGVGDFPDSWGLEKPTPVRFYTSTGQEVLEWKLQSGETYIVQAEILPRAASRGVTHLPSDGLQLERDKPLLLLSKEVILDWAPRISSGPYQGWNELLYNLQCPLGRVEDLQGSLPDRVSLTLPQYPQSELEILLIRILPSLLLSLVIVVWVTYMILEGRIRNLLKKGALLQSIGATPGEICLHLSAPLMLAAACSCLLGVIFQHAQPWQWILLHLLFHLLFAGSVLGILWRQIHKSDFIQRLR